MSVLSFEKPKKLRPTEEHNEMYSSDTNIAGTYVPNMSQEDRLKWKAKKLGGQDPRVEIRKTVVGTEPQGAVAHSQVLIVVRADTITLSANGRIVFELWAWSEFQEAVKEAQALLAGQV